MTAYDIATEAAAAVDTYGPDERPDMTAAHVAGLHRTWTEGCIVCEHTCDECGHIEHLWAPAQQRTDRERFVYDHATCWAETICRTCAPDLYAQALAIV